LNDNSHYIESGEVQSYAIRRVNPFLGVLQVIKTSGGRAISSNGVVWEIDLRTERSGAWGSLNQGIKGAAYYRFGLWSADEGLINRPLAPHLDGGELKTQCDYLIECVQARLQYIPFKLIDNYELWLFDRQDKRPVALLASLAPGSKPLSPEPKYWKSCLGANGVASQYRYAESRALESLIKQTASTNICKYWVKRDDDGSGVVERNDQSFKLNYFPPFLIAEEWSNDEELSLVSEYIAWVAPSLLTLQSLSSTERDRLEHSLNIQAVSVEHHWHLYPEINDEKKLKAARVQCRLQKTSSSTS
jgi:hypothetical protein